MIEEEGIDAEEMVIRAILGEQVGKFMNTDMGQYMINRANDKKESALAKLSECNPQDSELIRKLQNDVWLATNVIQWLDDAIREGLQALRIIDNRSDES